MTEASAAWPDLHDAVLGRTVLDWETGEVRFDGWVVGGRTFVIRGTGVSSLRCPREFPWGHSAHAWINEAPPPEVAAEGQRLELRLQTGDIVVATARAFAIEVG